MWMFCYAEELNVEKTELYLQLAKIAMMAIFLALFIGLLLLGKLTITIG
jgi:hypothetical protein